MTYLDIVLIAKIVGTALFVGLPFLFVPGERLLVLLKIEGSEAALPLIRLYGWSVIALLVGYSFGFSWLADGQFPIGVVTMGLVSNAGATALLVLTGAWHRAVPMTIFLALIAASLAFAIINPAAMIKPL